jgi:hypothetical protein
MVPPETPQGPTVSRIQGNKRIEQAPAFGQAVVAQVAAFEKVVCIPQQRIAGRAEKPGTKQQPDQNRCPHGGTRFIPDLLKS